MASKLDRLAHWALHDFPDRKLFVLQAWTEVTEAYQDPFGPTSLFYEGRAAMVTITKAGSYDALETDEKILSRLAQLAVCAGVPFVSLESDHVVLGVSRDVAHVTQEETDFVNFLDNVPQQDLQFCTDYAEYFPELAEEEAVPSDVTIEEAIGGIDNQVLRRNDLHFERRLFFYPWNNVQFEDEEASLEWCGSPLRECVPCDVALAGAYKLDAQNGSSFINFGCCFR